MLEKTGIPTQEQVEAVFPDTKRLNHGPVAVIECFQPIPCDPCATSCPQQAIRPFADINDMPIIDTDKCNGCGICIAKCPGLAIMVVDFTWSDSHALVKMPYEFTPLPQTGETVHALDRAGKIIADAQVVQTTMPPNKTPIISISIGKDMVKLVRNIQIKKPEAGIICRCSDIDISEIRSLINSGYTSVDEIKRITRLGMGPCQGRNCIPLVMGQLANILGKPLEALTPSTHRPVVKSIKLGDLAAYEGQNAFSDFIAFSDEVNNE